MNTERRLEARDQALVDGVLGRQRRALAKSITLVESSRRDHQARADALIEALLPHSGRSLRVGITGAPGAGKSTFIEALGLYLIENGHRVAVLAIDPSSRLHGGSILGDKTRMERLSVSPESFIRPSPSGGTLGGVAEKTREAMLICEAAGFDVVIVETVGVGQSETTVAGMVDVFVTLQLPNAGDDLQAIKKGVVELADVVVVTKSDLDRAAAERARQQFEGAIGMLRPASPSWRPPVLALSARSGTGVVTFWNEVKRYQATMTATGEFEAKRQRQAVDWMWSLIDAGLRARFLDHPRVRPRLDSLRDAVAEGDLTPSAAARRLLSELDETT
ncbi:MAG: methylmalonyl Co-A mutase-associated GTPase MeaB [Isosphaeraceae bacterium]